MKYKIWKRGEAYINKKEFVFVSKTYFLYMGFNIFENTCLILTYFEAKTILKKISLQV